MADVQPTQLSEYPAFRELLDQVDHVAVWTVSEPDQFDYLSAGFEDIWDLPADVVRENPHRMLERVHPEDRDRIAEIMTRSEAEIEAERVEHRVVHRDGSVRWVDARMFPVHDADGAVSQIVGVSTDITEQKRREHELEVMNRILRHDIRNDMAVVTGWLDLLAEDVDGENEAVLDRIQSASQHVIELTEIAREYVDVIVGDAEFDLDPVAVRDVIEAEVDAARQAYPGATVEMDGDLPAATVAANELLHSVVRNLLNNAVQHNDTATPTVTVSVETSAETVTVTVADDGPGVGESRRDDLFGKGAKGLESAGTGIGLYLCHEIVDGYGGEISYEPNEPRGAVFRVELRRAD